MDDNFAVQNLRYDEFLIKCVMTRATRDDRFVTSGLLNIGDTIAVLEGGMVCKVRDVIVIDDPGGLTLPEHWDVIGVDHIKSRDTVVAWRLALKKKPKTFESYDQPPIPIP